MWYIGKHISEKQISFQISLNVMETSFPFIYDFIAILFRKALSFMYIEQIYIRRDCEMLWENACV